MITQIFQNYEAFLEREDKSINGVTQQMADAFPNWSEEKNNEGCWNCSDCSGCSRCSDCSDCSGCSRCSDCSGCSRCSDCSGCSGCSGLENAQPVSGKEGEFGIQIPTVENIHAKVLAAVGDGKALEMGSWHSCNTTHCRGGWVITLAGVAGKRLEEQTSSEFAAMAIYHKSSPIKVSPVRFYESNDVALEDIKRCAAEETKL